MALSKSYRFDVSEQQLALYGQVLSHPARVRIIEMLMQRHGLLFVELAESIPLSEPTVSNHLRLMERSGVLTKAEVYFSETGYALDAATYSQACQLLQSLANRGVKYCASRQTE